MNSAVSQEGNTLLLDFKCHCLLCLQHEDPAVLQQIAKENPRGLDFQSILCYLTGNPLELGKDNDGRNTQTKFYPVLQNLPPLCKLCYDILAELYLFHYELTELQRKIQSQTVAARQIVKGTTRKRGGMRKEFFNRMKGCVPEGDVKAMESFIGNFHDLILEADQKAVFPQLTPLTSSFQSQSSTIQAYHVGFVEPPMASNVSQTIPIQIARPAGILNREIDLVSLPVPSPSNSPVVSIDDERNNNRVAYQYGGNEKEEMMRLYEKLDQKKDDDVVILEDGGKPDKQSMDVIKVLEEGGEEYESDRSNEVVDLEYLKSKLPSSIIMELVDEQGRRVEEKSQEVIEIDDDDDEVYVEEMDQTKNPTTPEVLPQEPIILLGRTTQMTTSAPTTSTTCLEDPLAEGPSKPFMCGFRQCKKRFRTYKLRETHERVHTGERPFVCDICGNNFTQSSTLYRHKRASCIRRQQTH